MALLVAWTVEVDRPDRRRFGAVDLWALPLLAVFLAGLELLLKEAPKRGWGSAPMLLLAALCASPAAAAWCGALCGIRRR